ncbi:putative proline iminopeptidase [Monoraphidium neglectum]|uniref:Putative proline iminopeptidase n=1 Tax=Monoraphidium neglectum TaxID=145388 RepID=A0A0D2LSP5_9CHLO|nr:putative proline iminopeptidase [Monoraphidium neglectum]KIY92806.1 putative proline iminopeptidase [Monoraphidium neglectum]|eukprot:XP_013891826.1 putative proline iminopeptidase [Monoraphidium neglectum]
MVLCSVGSSTSTSSTSVAATEIASPVDGLRGLYPASTPFKTGMLRVSDLHTIYYEVHGNPKGAPALFLHGGPGAGCYASHARFFDPSHYMIVLVSPPPPKSDGILSQGNHLTKVEF